MAVVHKFIVLLFMAQGIFLVFGARRIDVKKRMVTGLNEWRARRSTTDSNPDAKDVLALQNGESLEPAETISTQRGSRKTKYKETYQGVEVEDEVVVIEQSQSGELSEEVTGQLVEGIEEDLPDVTPAITAWDALHIAVSREKDDYEDIIFHIDTDAKLVIRTEETADPDEVECFLVWVINYKLKSELSRPFYVIHAKTGDVVESWQGIDNFPGMAIRRKFSRGNKMNDILRSIRGLSTDPDKPNDKQKYRKYKKKELDPDCEEGYTKIGGIGGNMKNGMIVYGKDFPLLVVKKTDDICTMENENVEVIDIRDYEHLFPDYSNYTEEMWVNATPFAWDEIVYEAHKVDCDKGNDDEINGAYSPLNDVYHFCNEVYKMYREWFNVDPLKNMTIKARVHIDMENAFWDGEFVSFGDGGWYFHPLTTMDIVSHEIAHGFTEHHSGLVYNGESGGMNEAFSDMAGEAAEYFIGGNDWYVGKGALMEHVALRFMDDPRKDNRSIGNAENYCPGIDVHHSSGVFNRAFYILSNQPGWNIRKAFEAFTVANMMYWTPHSTFPEGACGVVNAASDLGYDVYQVVESFRTVGIEPCEKRRQGFLAMYNIHGKAGENVTFLWTVEDNTNDAHISLKYTDWWRESPDVDLYVNSYYYNLKSAEINVTEEEIFIPNPVTGPNHIVINGREDFTKIKLTVMSSGLTVATDLAYEWYNETQEHFQMALEISEDQISAENTVAVRITHTNITSTSPYGILMRYEEKVDTNDWLFDYAGENVYDDDWNLKYAQVVMCKPKAGLWYLAIGGSFSDIDVSINIVHFPLKLQEPGQGDFEGKNCW